MIKPGTDIIITRNANINAKSHCLASLGSIGCVMGSFEPTETRPFNRYDVLIKKDKEHSESFPYYQYGLTEDDFKIADDE